MQTVLVLAVSAAAIGGVAWLIAWSKQVQRQQDFERKVQARKLGWRYDSVRNGRADYRFSGSGGGVEWSMWYDSDRGNKSPRPKASWKSANVTAPNLSLVIIGRKRYQMESGVISRLVMDVVAGVAQAVSGSDEPSDKSDFYESSITLDEGRPGFRERFVVAVAPDMPRGWLDESLQALLLDWPKSRRGAPYRSHERIEVTLRADGLRIVAQQMPEDFALWNHLAKLGEALAQRLGRLAGR